MKPNKSSVIANSFLAILALLIPLVFLPITTEFFEFNKLILVFLGVASLIFVWIFNSFTEKTIFTYKSILDAPAFLILIAIILSTIFSVNKDLSIFGAQGRWFPSLFSALLFYAYYYMALSGIREKQHGEKILGFMAVGITIASLASLLSYFGIYLGSENYFRINSFNTYGSINYSAIFASFGALLAYSALLNQQKLVGKLSALFSLITNLFLALLVFNIASLVLLITGVVLISLFVNFKKYQDDKVFYFMAAGTVIGVLLITLLPATRGFMVNKSFPQEVKLPLRESWIVASSVIRDNPLLGTGPSAFSMDYAKYKPVAINSTNLWAIKFDKPINEWLNILSNLGLVGFVMALLVASRIAKLSIQGLKGQDTRLPAIFVTALSTLFFTTHFGVSLAFVYATMTAILVAATAQSENKKLAQAATINLASLPVAMTIGEEGAIRKEYFHYVINIPLIAIMIYAGYITFRLYTGEYYMQKSIEAANRNDGIKVFEYQAKAIQYNKQRDVYQNAFAQTNLALANSIAAKTDLTDQDKQTIQQLISQAIRNTRITTELLNPYNADNWIVRANLYRAIAPVAQNSAEWAVLAYNNAIQLSPTDPRIRLDLGGLYYAGGDYLTAASFYRQAISLKGDYANAHFNFAQALIKLQDFENARKSLEVVKSLVPAESEDYKLVEQQIASLPGSTGQAKPTVEQLEGTGTNTQQEPLTTVGQEEVIKSENLNLDVLPKANE